MRSPEYRLQVIYIQISPHSNEHGTWSRNHDYKRLGTLSLLAVIDLLTGEVTHIVMERHR